MGGGGGGGFKVNWTDVNRGSSEESVTEIIVLVAL